MQWLVVVIVTDTFENELVLTTYLSMLCGQTHTTSSPVPSSASFHMLWEGFCSSPLALVSDAERSTLFIVVPFNH